MDKKGINIIDLAVYKTPLNGYYFALNYRGRNRSKAGFVTLT